MRGIRPAGAVNTVTFEELGVRPEIARAAEALGWAEPTRVQAEAIPAALSGRDIIAKAQTGTGKTGAYAMAALSRTEGGRRRPSVLVIVPTRELALQVELEFRKLSKTSRHYSLAVYGGADMRQQAEAIRRGADVIVGTPGRLRDMCERGILSLDSAEEAVIDEADRMMEMGFEEDLNAVLAHLPEGRHTMMFSATMTPSVERLEQSLLRDPVTVDATEGNVLSGLTRQYVVMCRREEKRDVLRAVLARGNPKAIVFCATKTMVDTLYEEMRDDRRVGTLHGDMPQELRERVVRKFRDNRTLVLIATDVAARGLDIEDVDLVVNFDAPSRAESYIHRIGRTGRAGREGTAVTIATRRDMDRIRLFEDATDVRIRRIEPEDLEEFSEPHEVVHHERRARPRPDKGPDQPPKKKPSGRAPDTVSLIINLGKKDGMTRTRIADMVRKRAGLPDEAVGKVGLGEESSFVEVDAMTADAVIDCVDGTVCEGKDVTCDYAPEKESFEESVARKKKEKRRWRGLLPQSEPEARSGGRLGELGDTASKAVSYKTQKEIDRAVAYLSAHLKDRSDTLALGLNIIEKASASSAPKNFAAADYQIEKFVGGYFALRP